MEPLRLSFVLVSACLVAASPEKRCDFPVYDGATFTPESFKTTLMDRGQPALITNAAVGWPAFDNWRWDNLEEYFGEAELRVGPGPYPNTEIRMRDYLDTASSGIFQYGQVPTSWTLWNECIPIVAFMHQDSRPLHDNTTFVCDKILSQVEVPRFLVAGETPPAHITHSGLLVGVPGSGIDFHSHQEAINVLIHGKKQWYMKVEPDLTVGRNDKCVEEVCSEGELARRLQVEQTELEEPGTIVGQCVHMPGEIVYIPEGVQHGVVNLENSVAMQMQWPQMAWGDERERNRYKAYLLHAVDPDEPDPLLKEL